MTISLHEQHINIQIIKIITGKPKLYEINFRFLSCMPGSIAINISTWHPSNTN